VDINSTRADDIFSGRPSFEAIAPARSRLASVAHYDGVTSDTRAYLGTFRFAPTVNARGEFTIAISPTSRARDTAGRDIEMVAVPLSLVIDR